MDVQVTSGELVCAIAVGEIPDAIDQIGEVLRQRVSGLIVQFVQAGPSPERTLDLENVLADCLQKFGRDVLQWLTSVLEPELEQMPKAVTHGKQKYRRLSQKTHRSNVLTRFGNVSLVRACYRRGRSGRTIFPQEILLGIEHGFTPAAADRVGKQFAATGSSQGRTLEMIQDQMGEKIGAGKLRNLVGGLAEEMELHREQAQVNRLLELIALARENGQKPVLSISRDGVALGLAPWSVFEMASVATISVMAAGKRLGTVYLGRVPEENQTTLSNQFTSLLKKTIRQCGDDVPEIVYVTDAGKVETAYWKNTLRKFFVAGKRIRITRVVDFYHAAERLTSIADALKFGSGAAGKLKRKEWLENSRTLLLEPGGHGRVLRSIATMRDLYGYRDSGAEDAGTAEKYLRRYRRFMDYWAMKELGYPIGSGIVESACKQIVSERMKLSGMRWQKAGAQVTMTLRCILLSGIWNTVYKTYITAKQTVNALTQLQIQ